MSCRCRCGEELLILLRLLAVLPVVAVFEPLLVGSTGMKYERLPSDQADMALWCLNQTEKVVMEETGSWKQTWLQKLQEEKDKGFSPIIPEFGFGDPTSALCEICYQIPVQ